MKKVILFLSLMLSLVLVGCNSNTAYQTDMNTNVEVQEQDGISVGIVEIKKENEKTGVVVEMNNHGYDLREFDIQARSSLNNLPPEKFEILNTAMGGHHVTAQLTFNTTEGKELIIGLTDELVFTFEL